MHGFSRHCASFQGGSSPINHCKKLGLPRRRKIAFHITLENPGHSFLCQVAGNRRKWGFFGQWSRRISWPRFYLPDKLPPADRVQRRRPCVSDLSGRCDACTERRRSRELDYECFWLRRSLIKRFNLNFKLFTFCVNPSFIGHSCQTCPQIISKVNGTMCHFYCTTG